MGHSSGENDGPEIPARRSIYKRRSILFRTATLSGMVTILTLGLFIFFIIPYQKSILIDRMESTAEVVATSIDQVTVTSIVVEDYSTVIDHCMKVVKDRPSVLYLVITRKDGFSLIHKADGWRFQTLGGHWRPSGSPAGECIHSEMTGGRLYHYAHPLRYSGIDWGWIHIGLSLNQFSSDLRSIYARTILLALLCMLAGSVAAIVFARRLSHPILELNRITEQVAGGDLNARANISTRDEVESLADSFNQMTESLKKARDELEVRVEERTAELRATNDNLIREIAERKRAEEAHQQAEQELEAQRVLSMRSDRLRSLGEMAAGIAHELNQPLVGVRGLAEHVLIGLDRGWDLPEEKLRGRMTRIVEQADRMVHIIEHVRLFAREAGKPDLSPVQVNDVAQSVVDMLGAQFRSHGMELNCEPAEGLPRVLANPFSLEEVVINLLNNARDAVEDLPKQESEPSPGRGRVRVRTGLDGTGSALRVKIEVADTGVGIPQDVLSRIFDPFFTTKDPDKGTGLGLSVSKSIIETFGGELLIRSAFGDGTTVTISLPALRGTAQ